MRSHIRLCVVCTTKNLEPIKVTYLSESGNDSTESVSKASSGTVVKMDTNTWHMCLELWKIKHSKQRPHG